MNRSDTIMGARPSSGRLPDFLGVGAQKGGTTSLHRLLRAHPQVFLPAEKELHYFSKRYGEGLAWYSAQYAAAEPHQRCGEITPYYLFHPEAPRRIHDLLPDMLLIVLLRDPVERALSQYFHSRRLGLEPLELEAALAAETERMAGAAAALARTDGLHLSHQEHSYVSRSRYERQLERYGELFPPQQLLMLKSEDLFLQPAVVWEEVQRFLGLEVLALPEGTCLRANAGDGEAAVVEQGVREQLRRQLAPTYAAMAERYGIHWA